MYSRSSIFYLTAFLVLLCSSCEKDELTKPVEVQFDFQMSREPQRNTPYEFSGGAFKIQSISFNGDREKGEDISFISDFNSDVDVDLETENTIPQVTFDLPQGIYKTMELRIVTNSSIVLTGKYKNALVPIIQILPIRLEMDIPELELLIKSKDGASEISLNRNTGATVKVYLNPADWFDKISLVALNKAELQPIQGIPSILISKSLNQEIYSNLTSVIPGSIEAVIE